MNVRGRFTIRTQKIGYYFEESEETEVIAPDGRVMCVFDEDEFPGVGEATADYYNHLLEKFPSLCRSDFPATIIPFKRK